MIPFGVCPNCPADFQTGAGNVTIAGGAGLATFTVAQTHDLMGVGAAVTAAGFGGTTYYVQSKISTTQWYLVDATGVAAPNIGASAVTAITHPFASQSAAAAGWAALTGNNNITAAGLNEQLHIPLYCEQTGYTADVGATSWDTINCDATHELFIYTPTNELTQCNQCQRALAYDGAWSDFHYRLYQNAGNVLLSFGNTVGNIFAHVEGVQIYFDPPFNLSYMVEMDCLAGDHVWVDACHLRYNPYEASPGTEHVTAVRNANGQLLHVRNCKVSVHNGHALGTGDVVDLGYSDADGYYIFTNNTVFNVDEVFTGTGSGFYAINNFFYAGAEIDTTVGWGDHNIYYGADTTETHSKRTAQEFDELFSSAVVWYYTFSVRPRWDGMESGDHKSDLIDFGVRLPKSFSADFSNPEGFRMIEWRNHNVKAEVSGEAPTEINDHTYTHRWDAGCLCHEETGHCYFGICPNVSADFKVASQACIQHGILYSYAAQNAQEMGMGAEVVLSGVTHYIAGKIDQHRWLVLDGAGNIPTDYAPAALTSITHPFASQSAFEAGFAAMCGGSDLPAQQQRVNGVCYCESVANTADAVAVAYNGTTCDATYYLRVWTTYSDDYQSNRIERNVNNGIWDATRYRHELASNFPILVSGANQYIFFVGLQHYTNIDGNSRVFTLTAADTTTFVIGCVIRQLQNNAGESRVLRSVFCSLGTFYLICNCAYVEEDAGTRSGTAGFVETTGEGDYTGFLYGNTVYNYGQPARGLDATENITTRNNAFINIANDISGIPTLDEDYDVYRGADLGQIHGLLTAQADAALFTAVAGGVETWNYTPLQGSDLIYRGTWLNDDYFHADLEHDQQELPWRMQGIAPDVGCIERPALISPFGVCPNCPANIEEGAGLVTMDGAGIATFDIPQVHNLMGVGADIDYGAGPAHAYVLQKISPLEWICRTGAGGVPGAAANQALNAINHPFASQSAAEAGAAALIGGASLVAADVQLYLPCYCEQTGYTVDAAAVTYDGITCDRTHRGVTYTPFSTWVESMYRHSILGNNGAWDTTRYRHELAGAFNILVDDAGAVNESWVFRGLQVRNTNAGNSICFRLEPIAASIVHIEKCLTRQTFNAGSAQQAIALNTNAFTALVRNTIHLLSAVGTGVAQIGIDHVGGNALVYLYNLMVYNFYQSLELGAAATRIAKNCTFLHNTVVNANVNTHDYNLYREVNEAEANGVLTVQTDAQLFLAFNAVNPELSDWRPAFNSDLVDNAMVATVDAGEFAWMRNADLDHPYYQAWRPQAAAWDIGPLEWDEPAPPATLGRPAIGIGLGIGIGI